MSARLPWSRLIRNLLHAPPAEAPPQPPGDLVAALAAQMATGARARLGRSLAIREIDAGSCGGCEAEIAALDAPPYELERFGLRFVDSPRQADLLLVSGPVTRNMAEALRRAHACMAQPAWVVAVGDCAVDGGCFHTSPAVEGGVGAVLPVDLLIPGCPPSPEQVLEGLLALLRAGGTGAAAPAMAPVGEVMAEESWLRDEPPPHDLPPQDSRLRDPSREAAQEIPPAAPPLEDEADPDEGDAREGRSG
ncbi:NADH-quinone oxidoreductase subunit B family protein [Roseomonas gilardii]|uniref:NADH-quinone oxidoreductase subunit B family protein n=1 Tax=Roseomonas gilardii TaxID=257708 RepID=UPI0031F55442